MSGYTLEVLVPSSDALDEILSDVEALSPRAVELADDPPRVLAWIAAPRVTLRWPHAITVAELVDQGSTWAHAASAPAPLRGLRLEQGEAFGSGLHPTTRLCLERIEARSPLASVLDVGTGTGVLALAALSLGAERAHGTDVDPAALELAARNAKANGVSLGLSVELPDERFELVVANIIGSALIELAPSLARALDHGATLLLSGVREGEVSEVARAYERLGLTRAQVTRLGGWALLEHRAGW